MCSSEEGIVFQEFISSCDPVSWAGTLFLDQAQVQNVLAVQWLAFEPAVTPPQKHLEHYKLLLVPLTGDTEELWQ